MKTILEGNIKGRREEVDNDTRFGISSEIVDSSQSVEPEQEIEADLHY